MVMSVCGRLLEKLILHNTKQCLKKIEVAIQGIKINNKGAVYPRQCDSSSKRAVQPSSPYKNKNRNSSASAGSSAFDSSLLQVVIKAQKLPV